MLTADIWVTNAQPAIYMPAESSKQFMPPTGFIIIQNPKGGVDIYFRPFPGHAPPILPTKPEPCLEDAKKCGA